MSAQKLETSKLRSFVQIVANPHSTPDIVGGVLDLIGLSNPLVLLAVKFGIAGLQRVLPALSGPTFTEEEVEMILASEGHRVVPFDPASLLNPAPAGGK